MRVVKKIFVTVFVIVISGKAFPQKYNFVNFTVEDGLIQSQAMHIVQDKNRYLWIATEGGLCKFDGKLFEKYSSRDGLVSNFINRLLCDNSGRIWVATKKGISVFNGKQFQTVNIGLPANVSFLCEAEGHSVYAVCNLKLGVIQNSKFSQVTITDTSEKVTSLYKASDGHLLASVYSKGVYCLVRGVWSRVCAYVAESRDVALRSIFITSSADTFFATGRGLYRAKNGLIVPAALHGDLPQNIFCIEQLNSGIWIGTDKGAYKIDNGSMTHFNSKNGLTDNNVYSIFKDRENNLWFASDADGIFKYKENNFSFYDKSFGLINPTIMGVAQTTDKNIYAADYSGNLYRISDDNKIELLKFENTEINESKINTIYADEENNLYIGSLGKRMYCYNIRHGVKVIAENAEYPLRGSNCFLKDKNGNLLIGNGQGIFVVSGENRITKVNSVPAVFNAMVYAGGDNVMIGSTYGLMMMDKNYKISYPAVRGIENNEILCLKYKDGVAWLGSTERGAFRWDMKTNTVKQYNVSKGLPSDFIYSIIVLSNNNVWLGTGFGICNLVLNNDGDVVDVKNYSRSDGLIGMECNHTSELLADDSTLWFGTTKGLAHFKPSAAPNETVKPFVILKSVKLFSAPITDSALCKGFSSWYNIPEGLVLGSKQNHLTFELGGIYLSNPEDILYKYKLGGVDKDYTISNNPVINYPALPPGKYSLVVYAVTRGGVISENPVIYDFEIKKAFYQEAWFLLVMFLALAGSIGFGIFLYLRKKQNEKLFREKVREEEFTKLRQRTAEDFHDEMGNKLTRISILSDILKSKVAGSEGDTLTIVNQIKENTTALYNGSRDIIWSLNSRNDNFYEITEHVKILGLEIFSDTNTNFKFDHNLKGSDNIKLKLDYSRNLIMIFKEVYNNILKHSQASSVNARLELVGNNEALIMISDNGRGFDAAVEHKGNGLKNIQNRVNRINGTFKITSSNNNGTEILISLKDIFHI